MGGQGISQSSKAPDLVGDILGTHDRNVNDYAVIDEIQQLAVAHIQLGQRPADGGQVLQHPRYLCTHVNLSFLATLHAVKQSQFPI